MEKYYKIGEIAKLYGISIDALRYYEDLGLITPKRGSNGYRYYSINHIQQLNTIRDLRTIGFSMEEIGHHLKYFTVADTISLLDTQIDRINHKINHLEMLKKRLKMRKGNIISNKNLLNQEGVVIKSLPERKILIFNDDIKGYQDVDYSLKKLQHKHAEANYVLSNCSLGAIASLDEVLEKGYGSFMSVFYILPDGSSEFDTMLTKGKYLSLVHKGSYDKMKDSMKLLLDYIDLNGLKPIGNPLEIYIVDEYDSGDENEFVTEIQIPIDG
ncbi:MAG: MerR family transcriptional regulator [Anaerovoracaceae bacterium]